NLGDDLVDLHGPHDHQSLLSPETQLGLLDSFARAQEQLDEYRKHYRQLQALTAEHAALNTAETAREQELDLLRHQTNEIKSANLVAGEEEEIEKRYKLASNSKRLIELANAVANKLSDADDSILSQLAETQRLLRELEKIDNSLAQFSSGHAASVVELSEIARGLSSYAEKLDLDSEQLAALEQRVSLFETFRKYPPQPSRSWVPPIGIRSKTDCAGRTAPEWTRFGGITFLTEPWRTAQAAPRHRIQRRNLSPNAGDQVRAGCPRRNPAPG